MSKRGSLLHRGIVAYNSPLTLGSPPRCCLSFSICNFSLGFTVAVILIAWILAPFSE